MLEVNFYDTVDDDLLKFAVIISQSNGKWVMCKHKERDTYEVPGGHREEGEDILETAKMLSVKLDAPAPCRLDAPDLDLICYASADCLHQHLQVI